MGQDEEARIVEVYRGYGRDPATRARWGDSPGNRLLLEERQSLGQRLLLAGGMPPYGPGEVLEVGCGTGVNLQWLAGLGVPASALHGVDLLAERIAKAREILPAARLATGNATCLDYPNGRFRLILLFTVFSSILEPNVARALGHEVCRVLAPGGGILWYDLRVANPRNRHVRRVSRQDLATYFPGYDLGSLRSVTLAPPLARWVGCRAGWLYPVLARLPLLRTHTMGLLKAP